MSYAVLHMQKMKKPAIKGMQIHNQREKESQTNPDIDPDRSNLNYDLVNRNPIDYQEKVESMIQEGVTTGKAIRKDAVRLASFLVTSDAEYFEGLSEPEEKRFFESAYEYFAKEYGEKNLAYAVVHKDEKTPHMHVGFVPITEDGRLSAKDFFGKKQQLVKLQDKFHEHMEKEGFDLQRGVSSDRKHVETAKYKALTFQEMEQGAKERYEKTVGQIQAIEEKTKSLEDVEAKKVLGLVGMKEQDYKTLVNYATDGAVYEQKVVDLQNELNDKNAEIEQLRMNMQIGQDKVRQHYKFVEENLDAEAEKKSLKKLEDNKVSIRLKEAVTKHDALAKKYNNLVESYNNMLADDNKLKDQFKSLLETEKEKNRSYREENRVLKERNKHLTEKVHEITKEFSAFKERVANVLSKQVDRVKTLLRIKDVDREAIRFIDQKQEGLVQDSLKDLEKPLKAKDMDMGIER